MRLVILVLSFVLIHNSKLEARECLRWVRALQFIQYPRSQSIRTIERQTVNGETFLTLHVDDWRFYQLPIGLSSKSNSLWSFVALFPDFAAKLGFKMDLQAHNLTYLDTASRNKRLDQNFGEKISTRFWNPPLLGKKVLSDQYILEQLKQRRVPISRSGFIHYHDLLTYWFYQIIPNVVWESIEQSLSAIQTLRTDPQLASSKKFQKFLDYLTKTAIKNIESYAFIAGGRFNYEWELKRLPQPPTAASLSAGILDLIVKDTIELSRKFYIANRVQNFDLESFSLFVFPLELDQSSPQDFWRDFAARRELNQRYFDLTTAQYDRIARIADTLPGISLNEEEIRRSFENIFQLMGMPNLQSYLELAEYNRAHAPWTNVPTPPAPPPPLKAF